MDTRSCGRGLLSLLRDLKKKDSEFRFLMLGLDNSGKTTALKQMAGVRLRGRMRAHAVSRSRRL